MASKKLTIHLPSINIWRISTIVLALVLLAQVTGILPLTGLTSSSGQDVGNKAVKYINENLVEQGSTATLTSVKDVGNLYEIVTTYKGNKITVYASKDGNYLFLNGINMAQTTTTTTPQVFNPTKQAVPEVNLFVMSFCPYGTQAEQLMKPVVDLLGSSTNLAIRFIVNVQGTTVDSIQSLHGVNEVAEDLRQVCIMKYYNQTTYWNYIMQFDSNCPSYVNDAAQLDTCWKAAANKYGIDTAKIQSCANSTDAINLLKADEALTNQYGVSGSPTLIINGATYNGARSSDAFNQAICSGFTTKPAGCSQNVTSTAANVASGACGSTTAT